MKVAKFWSLLLLLFTVGCGRSPAVVTVYADRKDPTDHQINAAKNGNLTCEFEGECEPALTMVSIATGEGVSRCSGFLISDHQVMTNDHCLTTLRANEDACQGLVFLHFTDQVHRGCKKVTLRSGQTGINSKDYAVIELDQPVKDRKALKVSKRGFANHESAVIYSVQATRDSLTKALDGKQVKLNCQASYSTLLHTEIASSKDSLMTFGDCAIQAGNSGSPVLNDEGEVGAIIQGFLSVNDDVFTEQIEKYLLDGSYGQVALGSQTRCIPELVGSVGNKCNPVKALNALYPNQYLEGFGDFSEKSLPELQQHMNWIPLKTENKNKMYVSSPDCINPYEAKYGSYSFTSSVVSYRQGINARLQAEWRSIWLEGEKQTLFVIQKTQNEKPMSVDFVSEVFGRITVPVCK